MATILVVDDRPAERGLLAALLGRAGHRVLEAADGSGALALARAQRPDLIIAEIGPAFGSADSLYALRADPMSAATPVVLSTACRTRQAEVLARAVGATRVLVSPADTEAILGTVGAVLAAGPPTTPPGPNGEFTRDGAGPIQQWLAQESRRERRRALARVAAVVRRSKPPDEERISPSGRPPTPVQEGPPGGSFQPPAANRNPSGAYESSWQPRIVEDVILNALADGVAVHDATGRIRYANEALARTLGFASARDLLAAPPKALLRRANLLDEEGRALPWARLPCVRVLRGEHAAEILVQWRAAEGHDRRWAVVRAMALPGAVGQREVVQILHDDSTRRGLEQRLGQAQKMEAVGRLAAGVAHDFNNLLTVVLGCGNLLLDSLAEGDAKRELARDILTAGERAASLITQLLAFSRREAAPPPVIDLNAALRDGTRMLRRLIGEDIRMHSRYAPAPTPVKFTPGQVAQVMMNLAVNARDAMPAGGELRTETRLVERGEAEVRAHPGARPGPHVLLAVSDTGIGMHEATRASLFEPFFTTKGPGQGTGLGLATVQRTVTGAGGHIEVDSAPGKGTTFRIYLPRAEGPCPEGERSPRGLPERTEGTETLLLVEDDEHTRVLMRRVLEAKGYRVLDARKPCEAMLRSAQHAGPIDLLVTDVVLPEMTGGELADRLTGVRPGLRVLLVSGHTGDNLARHGVVAERYEFLQKPFTPTDLALKMRDMLDRSAQARARAGAP
jgi:signal transduction histidine kinase/DNA-binding response OmpR family regulator